ncbi:MAG: hypothetical protein MUC87_14385 [Bacteroidia bacterium]|jgi:antitoxin component YwqK of YwqJK toxin-antitoxin module|nr:hypothetical protein [Bacteroidia bacterium]
MKTIINLRVILIIIISVLCNFLIAQDTLHIKYGDARYMIPVIDKQLSYDDTVYYFNIQDTLNDMYVIAYHSDSSKKIAASIHYYHGKREGVFMLYTNNGLMIFNSIYANNKVVFEEYYYLNGQIKCIFSYSLSNDKIYNGTVIRYYPTGQVQQVEFFLDDEPYHEQYYWDTLGNMKCIYIKNKSRASN